MSTSKSSEWFSGLPIMATRTISSLNGNVSLEAPIMATRTISSLNGNVSLEAHARLTRPPSRNSDIGKGIAEKAQEIEENK